MNKLTLLYIDRWGRKVYQKENGKSYAELDGTLYALTSAGEPSYPTVAKVSDFEVVVSPSFVDDSH